jgi:hypothetical protein
MVGTRVAALAAAAATLGSCGGDGPRTTSTPQDPTTLRFEAATPFPLPAKLGTGNPVRIAGINIGTVTGVTRNAGSGVVQMRIRIRPAWPVAAGAWPVRTNAQIYVYPPIFKEERGDYFVDVRPGTYRAPGLSDGARLPAARANSTTTPYSDAEAPPLRGSSGPPAARKPISLCVPSQNGRICDFPQRHSAIVLRPGSISRPSWSVMRKFPRTMYGPSQYGVIVVGSSTAVRSP